MTYPEVFEIVCIGRWRHPDIRRELDEEYEDKMSQSKMYVITETSRYMMSYVMITDDGNCVIVDGGRPEDIPLLREKVKGHPIKAWILTHPHVDHISAFVYLMRNREEVFCPEAVYYNFPPVSYSEQYEKRDIEILREFYELVPGLGEKVHNVYRGDVLLVDNLRFEFLYHWEEAYNFVYKTINDTSIVFRVDTQDTSVMFLGDLGPEGGDKLMELSMDKLKADYVQMAHHGHAGVGAEVYMMIDPKVCIWNAPDWLMEEPAVRLHYRRYGQKMTRYWMEKIGVKKHIVTMNGTAEIQL